MTAMHDLLSENPALFLSFVTILGMMVGSFLNVVIYRFPIMLKRQWAEECRELLEPGGEPPPDHGSGFNLIAPRSACPQCGHQITAPENIPVLSYIFLRGRCSACGASISIRYPLVEAATGIASLLVAWRFGYTLEAAAALPLVWALIALAVIDFHTKLLPDAITLPFVWAGLLVNLGGLFTDLESALLGAVLGYLSLWTVYHVFKKLTGKEGMGFGDFKLLAMLGAWLGWQSLPLIIILSALVGAVTGIALMVALGRDRNVPIPFGPFLAAAGLIALLWGPRISQAYLDFAIR